MPIPTQPKPTAATITVRIPFLVWTGRADLEIQVPSETEPRWHLRAALEIANRDGASLDRASLDGASLDGASLVGANLAGANLLGARLDGANLDGASLDGANLAGANLDGARLVGARLVGANLAGASLDGARLVGANLDGANLLGANLAGANLAGANLAGANLDGANLAGTRLDHIRNDFWDVLLRAQPEVPALLATLRAGRVDGSAYQGECACLAGTIANVRGVNFATLGFADASRPIERWFLGIKEGDTPETSQIAKITEGWIDEFQALVGRGGIVMPTQPKPKLTDVQRKPTIDAGAFERRIREQQSASVLYPLEVFCRECGRGHLATANRPGCLCAQCNSPLPVRHITAAQRTLAEYRNDRRLAEILAAKAPSLLRPPPPEIADTGKVRLGSGSITASFPPLHAKAK